MIQLCWRERWYTWGIKLLFRFSRLFPFALILIFILFAYTVLMGIVLLTAPLRVFFASLTGYLFIVPFWLFFFFRTERVSKAFLVSGISLFAVTGICVGSMYGYEGYLNSIRLVDNSNINTFEYLPFKEGSKVAKLDDSSSLRFSALEYLPKVDGAAALFPMYSSFVNAVYPPSIPELNRRDGCFYFTNTIESAKRLFAGERDVVFGVDAKPYANYDENPDDIVNFPIGREGFVFFTNVQNKVDSLTQEQLRGIYSGKITSWAEVGGDNMEIRPYRRNRGSGSEQGLENFMKGEKIVNPPKDEYYFSLMSGIISAVSDYHNHPGAIAYSYHYYASALMKDNNIKLLAVDGIAPNKDTIGDSSYPLTNDFYANTRIDKYEGNTKRLIDWVLSSQGQELVEKSGYAPIK